LNKYHKLRAEYLKKGYSIHRNVIPNNIVKEIQRHIQFLAKRFPETRPESFHHDLLVEDPFIHHILDQKSVQEISKFYLGPNISLFGAHYIAKKPYDGKPVGWHQDGSYWPLIPMNVISIWIAGTHSKANNGCMRILPGTQNKKLLKQSEMMEEDMEKFVLGLAIHPDQINDSEAIDIELNPGDVSIHNPFLVHGSNPNNSKDWRIGLTLRYIPTSTFVNRKKWDCVLLNGKASKGINNRYVKKPLFKTNKHMKFIGFENYLN